MLEVVEKTIDELSLSAAALLRRLFEKFFEFVDEKSVEHRLKTEKRALSRSVCVRSSANSHGC